MARRWRQVTDGGVGVGVGVPAFVFVFVDGTRNGRPVACAASPSEASHGGQDERYAGLPSPLALYPSLTATATTLRTPDLRVHHVHYFS